MPSSQQQAVMECFDRLPRELRDWINYATPGRLRDDHILQGEREVRRCKTLFERGIPGQHHHGQVRN